MHRHGGARKGAGRPARSARVSHAARPRFDGRPTPLHVTVRMAKGVWNLRSQRGFRCVESALAAEQQRGALRVAHFSVQGNHLHLIVEADSHRALSRRMQGFGVRFARRVNAMMGRGRGRVLGDRYHARILRSPREVHRAIAYVLLNHVKHCAEAGRAGIAIDPFSSGTTCEHLFACLRGSVRHPTFAVGTGPPPLSRPQSWLLRTGWLRHGPITPVRSLAE